MALPPGPRSWPLIGALPSLGPDLPRDAMRFSQELGSDVIHINIGPRTIVLLSSMEAVEEAFSGEQFSDRPQGSLFLLVKELGIVNKTGKEWLQHRIFLDNHLLEKGQGFECSVKDEVQQLKAEIAARGQAGFDLKPLLAIATANVKTRQIFSRRYEYSDENFLHVATRMSAVLALLASPGAKMLGLFPSLRHLWGLISTWREVQRNIRIAQDFIEKHIEEHKAKFDPGDVKDFLDAYLAEMQRTDQDKVPFTEEQIRDAIIDVMFPAEDIATTLRWAILYMVTHPEIQKKVRDEIHEKISTSELPTSKDRENLPYTAAAILEVQRFCSLAPLGLPRANLENDVTIRGFLIPRGTPVLPNSFAIHRDPELWKFPDDFNPENFLGDVGEGGCFERRRGFMGQSYGRRMCPGLQVAQVELFVFFASLIQSFEFSTPDGSPEPSLEPILQCTRVPQPFKVCVKTTGTDK